MVQKLSDHLNISLGLAAQTDSADVLAIIRETNIAMDSGTMGDFVATIAGKGSDAGITVLNSGTNNADVQLRLDSAVAATLTGSQTLTNKTINLTNNSLTGTIGQWNAALSGGNSFTTLIGTETLTNKTLTSPVLNTVDINSGAINDISTFSLRDATVASYELLLAANSSVNASADRTLTFDVKNANRTLSLLGNLTLGGSLTTSGAYGTTLTATGTTSVTLPTSGTLISKDGSNNVTGINNITATGTVDGRDLSVDGDKLDLIEAQADVTDAGNVGTALTAFSTGTDATGSDLIPVYDASAGTWEKQTITNASLQGPAGGTGAKGQKGQAGSIGVDGDAGAKGQKGEVGQKGAAGSNGAAGAKGQKGEVGAKGAAGSNGAAGAKGQKGQKGEIGESGSGASGVKGQKGEVGGTGGTGAKGQKGDGGAKGQKGVPASSITNTTAPGGAVDGDLWWDEETGALYIYYNDGTSSQWVQFNNAVVPDGSITGAKLVDDSVTAAKLADNSVDSQHYVDGSIDRVHLAADIVDGTKIANDVINSEHYAAGSIDAEHLASNSVTQVKLADDAVGANELKSVVSFVVYNSAGTALKTIYGAGGT